MQPATVTVTIASKTKVINRRIRRFLFDCECSPDLAISRGPALGGGTA
jgi:hypothetical protein